MSSFAIQSLSLLRLPAVLLATFVLLICKVVQPVAPSSLESPPTVRRLWPLEKSAGVGAVSRSRRMRMVST